MVKKAILVISIILMSSLFLGCIDTDSLGLKSIGGGTDPIAEGERSGIFTECCKVAHKSYQSKELVLHSYHVVYNTGTELDIFFDQGTRVVRPRCETKNSRIDRIELDFYNNGKIFSYSTYSGFSSRHVKWDERGRVDPRSDVDLVDEANHFAEVVLKKGEEVRRRFAAGELDRC